MPRAQRGTVKPAFEGPQSASGDQHCQQASSGQEDCPPQGEEVSSCRELTSPSSSTRCCPYRGDPGTEVGLATLKPQLGEGRQESLSSWGPHCVLPLLVKQRELYSSLALPRFYKRRARPAWLPCSRHFMGQRAQLQCPCRVSVSPGHRAARRPCSCSTFSREPSRHPSACRLSVRPCVSVRGTRGG